MVVSHQVLEHGGIYPSPVVVEAGPLSNPETKVPIVLPAGAAAVALVGSFPFVLGLVSWLCHLGQPPSQSSVPSAPQL